MAGTSVETLLKKARPHIEIRPDLSVSALARAMEENRVWAAAVVDQGETLGLVSSVDVLFRVTAKGLDPRNTTVAQIMTPDENLVWVTPHALVEECFAIMAQHWIRDLPVFVVDQETRKRKLVGMITLLEVAEALLLYNQLIDMQKGAFLGTPEAAR